jgi:hypothetical protein
MIRTLFKHRTTQQKEFENIHGTNVRLLTNTRKLEAKVEVITGSGVPSKALGKNKDVYIDEDTDTNYYKKNGIWI